ncbi:MAG: Alpha-acetolactate decarboxylase [Syntrophus sp. SKADARSKE-3]|nr:Alpha-acetolactate decarboxylase [Syntrophus sp. SKADARSKE-3]
MSIYGMDFKDLNVSIQLDLMEDLRRLADKTGLSVSQLTENALKQYLNDERSTNAVYLSAPVNAMLKGYYEENTTLTSLKNHGNFGLGTFNNLDGEMVMLDNIIYQLHADGKTHPVADDIQTPFACVTHYNPSVVEEIEGNLDYKAFNDILNRMLPSDNMFYAIRVEGFFKQVKVWSVARQNNYQPLVEDEKNRPTFEYENIYGVLAGFYTPKFIRALNFPGFHMHFLTADRKHVGHLHECQTEHIQIGIQFIPRLKLDLPITLDYLAANLPR